MIFKLDTVQLRIEENQLRERVATLSLEQKRDYYALELEQIKDSDTYTVLNWFCVAGLHHFYLDKLQRGLINLFLLVTGLFLCISNTSIIFGVATLLLIFIIEFPGFFDSENIVKNYNNQLMKKLLKQFE